jgi:hypothetical protein
VIRAASNIKDLLNSRLDIRAGFWKGWQLYKSAEHEVKAI